MSETILYNCDIPPGWTIIDFNKACDKISLNEIKIKQKEYLSEGKYPVVDQGQELIGGYFDEEEFVIPLNPPYIVFGDHTKVKKYINFKFIAGSDGIKVLKSKEFYNSKLLFYFLHVIKIPDKGYARHFQFLEKSEIPLPPSHEQHRIVTKIEELFSELDKGVEALKTAQQQLKVYRQAVLKWAFEGKLTEEWRKQQKNLPTASQLLEQLKTEREKQAKANGRKLKPVAPLTDADLAELSTLPESWCWAKSSDICEDISDGDHQPPPKAKEGVPFITISNIVNNIIDFTETFYVSEQYYKKLGKNRRPRKGDILYTVTGSFGIPVLIAYEKKFCFQRHIGLVRPFDLINQYWLYYLLQAPIVFEQARKVATGTAQKTVSLDGLRNFKIPMVSTAEQQQIVQQIETRLSVADKLEETIAQSLQQAEAMRQSILKKAFAGQLVPQDPNDEPASKLLERIKAEKAAQGPVKRSSIHTT